MKKVLSGMLLFIAFSISANAQENKEAAKKESCCATGQHTASASTGGKCGTDATTTSTDKGASCSTQTAGKTESASTTTGNPVATEGDKKACKADGSCCGAKTAQKA